MEYEIAKYIAGIFTSVMPDSIVEITRRAYLLSTHPQMQEAIKLNMLTGSDIPLWRAGFGIVTGAIIEKTGAPNRFDRWFSTGWDLRLDKGVDPLQPSPIQARIN